MKKVIFTLTLITVLVSCKFEKETEKTNQINKIEKTMEVSNKEKAIAVLESLETGAKEPITYINPEKYIQHNLAVGDGLQGFGEVIKHAPEGGFKAKVIRAYQDGDYVFTHTLYDFFGPKVGFDVFRFEEGKIVEHWDNLLEVQPPNPSGRTQIDGATKIKDSDKTDANKQLVADFVETILVKGEMDKVTKYFEGDNYMQHNPAIGDGLSGLGNALEAMAKQGVSMVYSTTHKVLGEGNFVLAISEGTFAGQPTSFYDLFRVENGKIAEHWDVMETIAAKETWKNENGKFNFPN